MDLSKIRKENEPVDLFCNLAEIVALIKRRKCSKLDKKIL